MRFGREKRTRILDDSSVEGADGSDRGLRNNIFTSKTSINLIFGNIAVFISIFPWIGFGVLDIDSQPWPVISFVIYLFVCGSSIKLPRNIGIMALVLATGFFISLARSHEPASFLTIRAAYNYSCIIFVFLGFYNYLHRFGFPYKLVLAVNVIWLVGAFVEIFYPHFNEFLVPVRTSADRGLTSFAPEPTFYAIFLFFSSWLLLAADGYRFRTHFGRHAVNIGSIALLARSSMGVVYLVFAYGQYLIFNLFRLKINKSFMKSVALVLILLSTLVSIFYFYLDQSRVFKLASDLFTKVGISGLFALDASMNSRLESVVFSIHGAILNYLIPSGFDTFMDQGAYLLRFYNGLFWYSKGSLKVESWVGAFIYELGFLGLAFLLLFFSGAWDRSYRGFLELLLLFIILLSAVPLAFPLVPMLFSVLYYRKVVSTRVVVS